MNTFNKALLVAALALPMTSQAADVDFYGFIEGSVSHGGEKITSFGQDTLAAPTEAGQNDTDPEKKARMAFQSAQSRFGLKVKVNEKVSGKFEMDYGQVTSSTPTTTAIRARIAQISYKASDAFTVNFGKGWGLAAGLNPHSFNFIGNGFRSGNTVFMTEELRLDYKFADTLSAAIALGNIGANSAAVNAKEISSPSTSARFEWKTDSCRLGLAYSTATTDYEKNGGTEKLSANIAKLYFQHTDSWYNARIEYYTGQHVNDLTFNSGLTGSASAQTTDKKENGAFISAQFNAGENGKVHVGYGFAQVDDKDNAVFAANDIVKNTSTRLGYGHKLSDGLYLNAEHTAFSTDYKGDKEYSAGVTEIGMLLKF